MSMLMHRFCKMLHQIRKVYERIPSLHGNGRWIHGPWLYSCRMLKKDSASQVQFQPSPARAPSHLQAAAATSQVALPKTWKALNIACRMPGTHQDWFAAQHPPKKQWKHVKTDPKGGPQRSSDIYIWRTSDKWISHQLSGHLSTRRKCEGEFRYLSQTLTRLPTSLHRPWQSFWSTGFNTPNPSLNGSPAPKSKISGAWRSLYYAHLEQSWSTILPWLLCTNTPFPNISNLWPKPNF